MISLVASLVILLLATHHYGIGNNMANGEGRKAGKPKTVKVKAPTQAMDVSPSLEGIFNDRRRGKQLGQGKRLV